MKLVPLNPSTVRDGSVINVYYIADYTQTKTINYTINYYQDGEIFETITDSKEVWVNAPDTTTVEVSAAGNRYVGYKLDPAKEVPANPSTVSDGSVINVYYVADYTQTKKISYKVEYYIAGDFEEFELVTKDVWVNATELSVDPVNTNKDYVGYKFDYTYPEELPAMIAADGVIKVYYIADYTQTKTINYTINYYQDGEIFETITDSKVVWINAPDTTTVEVSATGNRYVGYKLDPTKEVPANPSTVSDGLVINVYYVADYTQTKTINYTINYYQDGEIFETINGAKAVWINASDTTTVEVSAAGNRYVGYKLDPTKEVPANPSTVSNGTVINVYYVADYTQTKKISYIVDYYKDNKYVESSSPVSIDVWVNAPDEVIVDAIDAANDRYDGYVLDRINPALPATIGNNYKFAAHYNAVKPVITLVSYSDKNFVIGSLELDDLVANFVASAIGYGNQNLISDVKVTVNGEASVTFQVNNTYTICFDVTDARNGAAADQKCIEINVVPIPKYTVNFVDYDGRLLHTEEVQRGSDATAPADPSRANYTFAGWDKDFTNITGPLTVTAKYEAVVTLTRISATLVPTVYALNESMGELFVYGYYRNEATGEVVMRSISSGYTHSDFSSSSTGTKNMLVSYNGFTDNVNYYVYNPTSSGDGFIILTQVANQVHILYRTTSNADFVRIYYSALPLDNPMSDFSSMTPIATLNTLTKVNGTPHDYEITFTPTQSGFYYVYGQTKNGDRTAYNVIYIR